jgi:CxxC motif-containing protein
MIDRMTCLLCPAGCELEVEEEGDRLEVRGAECEKGREFAESEVRNPLRNLATSVPLQRRPDRMVSVRLSRPVPRDRIFPILEEIGRLRPEAPVRRGQVLLADVLGSGADVIATRTVPKEWGDGKTRPSIL